MRVLITGGGGQLASDLTRLLGSDACSLTHAELDITDSSALSQTAAELRPEVVINCGAFHNLDACEAEPETAWRVNVEAVRQLARLCPRLVHISTNYVFGGDREAPYAETDVPSPRSVYALTKLAGEYAAVAYGEHSLVVRTAGLYGLSGSASKGGNFVQRMISRARDQGLLQVVADQYLQPTFTADLAMGILEAIRRDCKGIIHLTSSGACSWHEFTLAITQRAGIEVAVQRCSTVNVPGSVRRPLNGVLARPGADACGIPPLRHWADALSDYMERAGLLADLATVH